MATLEELFFTDQPMQRWLMPSLLNSFANEDSLIEAQILASWRNPVDAGHNLRNVPRRQKSWQANRAMNAQKMSDSGVGMIGHAAHCLRQPPLARFSDRSLLDTGCHDHDHYRN